MSVVAVLAAHGGVARRHQLLARGLTDRELLAAVAAGAVARPHRGCYALPDANPRIVRARVMSAQLTCITALREVDLPLPWGDGRLHLAVPADRGIAVGDRRLRREEVFHHFGSDACGSAPVVPIAMALDHLSRCLEPRFQLAAVDGALHLGLIAARDLQSFTTTPTLQAAWLRAHADARAESMGESIARLEVRQSGLRAVPQQRVRGVGRVDLVVEDVLAVEIDGTTYHSSPEARMEDARRDAALAAAGLGGLRIPHDAVVTTPGEVARRVCTALGLSAPDRYLPGA